ncbi:UNVERIFIED_CONTAM: hypothetical protein GTU68_026312, partial [Idotea baltica]|nr:hypothetical protein [Idotea baltica]
VSDHLSSPFEGYSLPYIITRPKLLLLLITPSVSVCELVNLIYETLEEACVSVPEFAVRLFHTVRNIMSMYCHVIPTAHAHTLSTTPEHAALVHNNSLFVSHHALLLGHHYKNRFPESLRDMSLTTVDLGSLIRNSGCEVFLKAMQGHKNTVLQTLKEGLGKSHSSLHSSVKECLKELQRLRVAWQPVLPRSVYVKSIGKAEAPLGGREIEAARTGQIR